MTEYISREAVINITAETGAWETQNRVRELSAADVQPVKRGKWEQDEKGAFHHCSECESKTFRDVDGWGYEYQEYLTDYCFRCGARMDGDT